MWTEFLGSPITLKHPQIFKTRPKVILATRGLCPGALESSSSLQVGDTGGGNLARTQIALPPGGVHILHPPPAPRPPLRTGRPEGLAGSAEKWAALVPLWPAWPAASAAEPGPSRAASLSAAPRRPHPPGGAGPLGGCSQRLPLALPGAAGSIAVGAGPQAPADRCLPAPESLDLRFFAGWWAPGLFPPQPQPHPPQAAGAKVLGYTGLRVGLGSALQSARRKWNCPGACSCVLVGWFSFNALWSCSPRTFSPRISLSCVTCHCSSSCPILGLPPYPHVGQT